MPQPYSCMSTPTPIQPFTPPSLIPSQNPTTPGSSHKLRGGQSSVNLFFLGQSPTTPSQLGQYGGSGRNLAQNTGEVNIQVGSSRNIKTYAKPTIGQSLQKFENVLASLVESVAKFRPNVEIAKELIEADEELTDSITELVEHHHAAQQLLRLRKVSASLDEQLDTLLVTLADCRRTLRGLPRPDDKYLKAYEQYQKQQEHIHEGVNGNVNHTVAASILVESTGPLNPRVSAQELLHYATKITKFTSAPPGYNQAAPEHANFPWPTEDEMRRGMLALSAIEGTSDTPSNKDNNVTSKVETSTEEDTTSKFSHINGTTETSNGVRMAAGRRNSLVDYGDNRPDAVNANETQISPAQLDLDLFDPDDDDDDEEDDEEMEDI